MIKKKILKTLKWVLVAYVLLLVGAYFFQDKLVFHPEILSKDFEYAFTFNFEEVNLKTVDNETINALHLRSDTAKGVILYFHGNSGSLKRWGNVLRYFTDYNYDVFAIDFRGYGKSTGTFNDTLMYQDAQLSYNYLKERYSENNIVVYGKSMGTTFATKVAADNSPKQLILEVPFYNLAAAGKHRFPFMPMYFLKYKFETNKYIKQVKCPITIFHGTEDFITPYDDSVELFNEATIENKQFITIEGGGHNDLIHYKKYHNVLNELLK